MSLLVGTDQGLYRVEEIPFDREDAERVLDCEWVTGIETYDHTDDAFVASSTGAYRSEDGGRTWEDLGVPLGEPYWNAGQSEVWSILATENGLLYAGTNDPYLFRSADGGETWTELVGFRDLPSRGRWESPSDPHYARLRSLEAVPDDPEHLVAGVEAGGVHVSVDGGRTWTDHRDAIVDDVHQVVLLDADVWLAATGHFDLDLRRVDANISAPGGLHLTTDAGETWRRLDDGNRFSYIREAFVHDGTIFFGAADQGPPMWTLGRHEAAVLESRRGARTFDRVPYPGEPKELVVAWTAHEGQVLCGSGLFDIPDPERVGMDAASLEAIHGDIEGRVMRRDDGEYRTVGRVPGSVSNLETV